VVDANALAIMWWLKVKGLLRESREAEVSILLADSAALNELSDCGDRDVSPWEKSLRTAPGGVRSIVQLAATVCLLH
jgi:hypothetical protein